MNNLRKKDSEIILRMIRENNGNFLLISQILDQIELSEIPRYLSQLKRTILEFKCKILIQFWREHDMKIQGLLDVLKTTGNPGLFERFLTNYRECSTPKEITSIITLKNVGNFEIYDEMKFRVERSLGRFIKNISWNISTKMDILDLLEYSLSRFDYKNIDKYYGDPKRKYLRERIQEFYGNMFLKSMKRILGRTWPEDIILIMCHESG